MFAATSIAGEIQAGQKLSAFTSNLTALLGLLILGFPVTSATIRTMVTAWVLIVVATLQLIVNRIRPQVCPARTKTIRQQPNELNHYAF